MRILVTNDDGIHAPGLAVAETIARALSDDVWVVAPESEQSGASHSLTLASPLRLRPVRERCYAVTGTPTDCVMMAALSLLKDQPPDLVLSGVNSGSNLADDVTYSGTVAGAMEGCALGIPAIALSQEPGNSRLEIDWSAGQVHGPAVVRQLVAAGWPQGVLLNVNFPAVAGPLRPAIHRDRGTHRCARARLLLDRAAPPRNRAAAGQRPGRRRRRQDFGNPAASQSHGT
jgi:5'-nucleotidase